MKTELVPLLLLFSYDPDSQTIIIQQIKPQTQSYWKIHLLFLSVQLHVILHHDIMVTSRYFIVRPHQKTPHR